MQRTCAAAPGVKICRELTFAGRGRSHALDARGGRRYRRLYCSPRPLRAARNGTELAQVLASSTAYTWNEPTGVCEVPGLAECLALMRLSCYDSDFFVVSGVASALQLRAAAGCWLGHFVRPPPGLEPPSRARTATRCRGASCVGDLDADQLAALTEVRGSGYPTGGSRCCCMWPP